MFSETTMALMDRALALAVPDPKRERWESGPGSEPIEWEPRVKYPDIEIDSTDLSANTFFMVAHVRMRIEKHLRECGDTRREASEEGEVFFNEALSGDADHALRTVMDWVNIS